MAIQIVSVFYLFLALIHNAAGSLHLDVSPTYISSELTKSLTINCTFTYVQVTNITDIISLFVSKTDQQGKFQDLISINAFSPDKINVLSQVNGSVLGHIDGSGESFLSIQWTYPGGDKAGMYKCEAHGMDDAGYSSELTQTVSVTSDKPDMNELIDKVSDLQRQLDRQENQTNYLTIQLDRQENMIETLLSLTKNQSDLINKQQAQLDLVKYASFIFNVSNVYMDHVYLLSKIDWNNATVAEQTCKDYNGYLAEIDNSEEDAFVNEFLATSFTRFDVVLISGTDQDHEGVWTYTGSTRNVSYTNWYGIEPNTPDNHCMEKYRGHQWQMHDYPCSHTFPRSKFLCEVNLQ